ncbi:hypothetical protein DAKH74_009270 [Maudiozyma humilis]|uniref:Uncharacterized protein n=1 Tax=Maudiozyma humilis TaxID=51915 RepID=A0AAV5RUJ7_MAUHU|nr:hypothetical protein DAKH74_009270 [Kazachstania humilis]
MHGLIERVGESGAGVGCTPIQGGSDSCQLQLGLPDCTWIYVIPIQCAHISTAALYVVMLSIREENTCVSQSVDHVSICETYQPIIQADQLQDLRLVNACLLCSNAMAQATQSKSLSTRILPTMIFMATPLQ